MSQRSSRKPLPKTLKSPKSSQRPKPPESQSLRKPGSPKLRKTGKRLLSFDRRLGARFVAGADEAGRGSLAGPLVVAGVLLDYASLREHRVRPLAASPAPALPARSLRPARRLHRRGARRDRARARTGRDSPPRRRGPLLSRRRLKNPAEGRALWHYRLRGYRILGTTVWAGGH